MSLALFRSGSLVIRMLPLLASLLLLGLAGCANENSQKLERAGKLIGAHDFDGAEKLYKEIIAKSPDMAVAHNNLGALYREMKRFDDSAAELQKAVDLYTESKDKSTALNNLGLTYDFMGQKEKAVTTYENALGFDQNNVIALNNLGLMYFEAKDMAKAATFLEKSIRLRPENNNASINLAEAYLSLKNYEKAFDAYTYVKEHVANAQTYALERLGYCSLMLGRPTEAQKYYALTLTLNPDVANAHAGMAEVHLKAGQPDLAVEEARKAAALEPGKVFVQRILGLALQAKNDVPGARAAYEAALKIDPSNEEILGFLAGLEPVPAAPANPDDAPPATQQ